jgi:hypothetical protein
MIDGNRELDDQGRDLSFLDLFEPLGEVLFYFGLEPLECFFELSAVIITIDSDDLNELLFIHGDVVHDISFS